MASCCASDAEVIYLAQTRGMCRECRKIVEARYISKDGAVYLQRLCPDHGAHEALVAESLAFFLDAQRAPVAARPPSHITAARAGDCPSACGPCEFHAQRCNLPVFSITNACDLQCPICFTYNRPDKAYFMPAEAFEKHLDFVVAATGGVDLVNITGGEPTLHPELLELLKLARRPEIGRVTVNTNGLQIARDKGMARGLAESGAYAILSFDTLDVEQSVRIHGRDIVEEKRRALDNLDEYGVPTTLLMVLIGGVNEDQLPAILELMRQRKCVRSLTIQTMTYTGQGGGLFTPRQHLPVDRVQRMIEEASKGDICREHFAPLPTAHPLCYGVNYLLQAGDGGLTSFAQLLSREQIASQLADGYLLHPSDEMELALKESIDRLWAEGDSEQTLRSLRELLEALYPQERRLSVHERQRAAEERIKTIYVHAHMDEDTYEVGRAMRCPDQVPVHAEKLIGACNYNLFYRMNDARFWVKEC